MSTLAVDRLDDESPLLEQVIELERVHTLVAIRPFLYVHGVPAGDFSFNIYDSNNNLLKSYPFTAGQAKTEAVGVAPEHNYFWVYLSLKGDCKLQEGTYTIKLESTDYIYTEEAWLSWVKDWYKLDSLALTVPSDFSHYPYSFKLIEYAAREF